MTETTTSTATPEVNAATPPANGATATSPAAAAPVQSALADGAKSEKVDSMLAAAAKAAASEPTAHDYGKLKADGLHGDVLKSLREAFGENKIAPDAAQKLLDKVLPTLNARREAEVKEVDALWQKELREDKDFGGENYDKHTKLVEAAVFGLLSKEQAQAAKDSGLLGNPLFARTVLAAERIVAKATKQDSVAVGDGQGGAVSESEQWAQANPKTVAGLRAMGIKV